jgi:hypothetical protein
VSVAGLLGFFAVMCLGGWAALRRHEKGERT